MPDPLPLQFVHHISRATRDLDTSLAFYRDLLGFRPIPRPNFPFPGAWLFNQGVQIHLIASNDGNTSARDDIQPRGDHVAFHVNDLGNTQRLLEQHGVPYKASQVPDTGVTQLFFRDPDGNHIEVGTYPPTEQ